jgi:heme-degrading monooxygenase HmoA
MNKFVYQLRIYQIDPKKRDIFHKRFQRHAMRIMKTYGFDIKAMWESKTEEKLEFIYLLKWPDLSILESQWKKFMADKEWIDIKKQTVTDGGEPVLQVSSRVLEPIEYSPHYE